jgi:penicillin amidase
VVGSSFGAVGEDTVVEPEARAHGDAAPRRGRRRRIVVATSVVVLVVVAAALGVGWIVLRASLPPLDGERTVAGIADEVRIERDAQGRVTVRGATADDVAFALGFAHGQDRYFQMDLLRRAGSGDLAALIGPAGVALDRTAREHGLHRTAREALARSEPRHRRRVEAYARGVNAGLASTGVRPWEYLLLRRQPEPWRAVDTLHVLHAMYRDLQPPVDHLELSRPVIRRTLIDEVADALLGASNPWDAPIAGGPGLAPLLEIPASGPGREPGSSPAPTDASYETPAKGSNSFAVGGAYTDDGRALLANDMHLRLQLPVIWYPVRTIVDGGVDAVGVTLPGAPGLIVGSNGSIAWGFTNSYGDWVDHVDLELAPGDTTRYRTPEGWATFGQRDEIIEVAGSTADTLRVRTTIWGPVTGAAPDGTPRAAQWVAHEPEAVGLELLDLVDLTSIDAALDLAPTCGIPHQNFVVAGDDGRLGWTIIGRVPRRVGFDGTVPVGRHEGMRRWDGWLDPAEVPRHVYDGRGRIWTANGRVTTMAAQRIIGDGGYALGARAGVIRDALRALPRADERALMEVQNEIRSPFLQQWYEHLRDVVRRSPESDHTAIERWLDDWTGGADASSVAYAITRSYQRRLTTEVYRALLAPALEVGDDRIRVARPEPVVWSILQSRPEWVPGDHADWNALEHAMLDSLIADWGDPGGWADHTWGAFNRTSIRHPLAMAMPSFLARFLRLPPRPVDGDVYTARVNRPTFGASQRLVVAPGAEERGLLHLPGGANAHPLSPFREGDYEAWVAGDPVPLLPGPAAHTLVLRPRP